MAVGPTEALHSTYYQLPAQQVQISNQMGRIMTQLMSGNENAHLSPNTGIPAAGTSSTVQDTGLGLLIDFQF